MKRFCRFILFALTLVLSSVANAAWLSWEPEKPGPGDVIQITIRNCRQGGVIHWGLNAEGNKWEQAIPAYRPSDSEMDGIAVRTRLEGPDRDGVCRIALGPFDNTNQLVGSLDFAFQWDDGEWDTRGGEDYHIPIYSQRITTAPEAPHINSRILVTIHRAQPGGELRWGVNAEEGRWSPPAEVYWPEGTVPFEDGLAVDTPLPDPDEDGACTISLGPFNRAEQVVTSLHMAVHWDDVWDTDFGRNYNVPVLFHPANEEPPVKFRLPVSEQGYSNTMPVAIQTDITSPLNLWLNGKPYATILEPPYTFDANLRGLSFGRHELAVRGESGTKVVMKNVTFWHMPAVIRFPVGGGFESGFEDYGDGTVGFALYAPHKRFVSVIGDFNDWNPNALLMHHFADDMWWIRTPLEPGVYHFQYLIDGALKIADPYSRNVEWKDADGNETYKTELAKSVIEVGAEPYEWEASSFDKPALSELVIYELHIEDFCPGEGYTGVIARLDYIEDLGVNAIEPLPVTECSGAGHWGYNPSFHFAPESGYGTPDELKRLIDECHKRGIAFIGDIVLNHMGGESALHQLYGTDYDKSPYFRKFLGENWGMPDIDQQSKATKRYTEDVLTYWIEEFRMDGFRYDATRFVEWEGYNDWGASWFAYVGRQADPTSYQIAEHLPTDPELMNTTEMDAGWHAHFRWQLRDMITRARIDEAELRKILDPRLVGFTNAFQRVTYVESHDEERMIHELIDHDYTLEEAVRRAEMGIIFTLTAPGIPMLYAGQEFGEDSKRVVGINPLNWDYAEQPVRQRLTDTTKKLTRLKTGYAVLQKEEIDIIRIDDETGFAAFARPSDSSVVIVTANFSTKPRIEKIEPPVDGWSWKDVLAGEKVGTEDGKLLFALQPGEARVCLGEPQE